MPKARRWKTSPSRSASSASRPRRSSAPAAPSPDRRSHPARGRPQRRGGPRACHHAPVTRGHRLSRGHMPDSAAKFRLQDAVIDCTVLALACLAAYWLVASVLSGLYSESRAASAIGGLWTVLATIFVLRFSYAESEKAALTRLA